MTKVLISALALAFGVLCGPAFAQGGAPEPQKEMTPAQHRAEVAKNAQAAIARFKKEDPGLDRFFKESAGYAVFPRVGKAGFIFSAGHGDGELFEKGKVVGFASITLASVGLTAGAQDYAEIVFFQNQESLGAFKQGKFEFGANASAVIVKSGVSKDKTWQNGAAVFAMPNGGAMAEASVGTQKFSFKPNEPAKKK